MHQEEKDTTLYNYLYNYILNNPVYACFENNQTIAKQANVSLPSITPTLKRLQAKGLIRYFLIQGNLKTITLNCSVTKCDQLRHELHPDYHYNPEDKVRIANIIMHQYHFDFNLDLHPENYMTPKLRANFDKLIDQIQYYYEKRIFSRVGMNININHVSVSVQRDEDLELFVECTHINSLGRRFTALLQFVVSGVTTQDLNENLEQKLNAIFPMR